MPTLNLQFFGWWAFGYQAFAKISNKNLLSCYPESWKVFEMLTSYASETESAFFDQATIEETHFCVRQYFSILLC